MQHALHRDMQECPYAAFTKRAQEKGDKQKTKMKRKARTDVSPEPARASLPEDDPEDKDEGPTDVEPKVKRRRGSRDQANQSGEVAASTRSRTVKKGSEPKAPETEGVRA